LVIYQVCEKINKTLSILRNQIKRMMEGTRKRGSVLPGPGSAEQLATRATVDRRGEEGDKGKSDQAEHLPLPERVHQVEEKYVAEGVPAAKARPFAATVVESEIKYFFQEGEIPGKTMFDIKSAGGKIFIAINTKHPARAFLFELLKEDNPEADPPALKALKLLLTAWARLEDEATNEQRRQRLEQIRYDWGSLAWDFLHTLED
jgi:hypothetical protein